MRFVMFVCDNESAGVPMAEADPSAWVREMDGRGVRLQGARLRPGAEARTVRVRDGETLLSDGPFVETKEWIGGFDLIECDSLDEAVEVASRHPAARYGWVEVRPLWER